MSNIQNIYDHPNYYSLDDFPDEVWRHIPGAYSRFFVSSLGRIKALESYGRRGALITPARIVKVNISDYYYRGDVSGGWRFRLNLIHQAVALAFVGPNPSVYYCVNHKNGVKWDNRPENLEWVTYAGNSKHAKENGLFKTGLDRDHSVQIAQYSNSGKLLAVFDNIRKIRESIASCSPSTVRRAVNRPNNTAGGFIWKKITKEEYFKLKAELEG